LDIQFNDDLIPSLVDRANKLDQLLKKLEREVQEINTNSMSAEDLLKYYEMISKNQMQVMDFVRKLMLLPKPDDSIARRLAERILNLPEDKMKLLEKKIVEAESEA
jgi:hypothetical protein